MASAGRLIRRLDALDLTLAVAESFTGGALMDLFTDRPGISSCFLGGVVAYGNRVKTHVLGVSPRLLARHGAVSGPVAAAMARGARRLLGADVGVATTGIAGPAGATATKPVGLSYVAVAYRRETTVDRRVHAGDRRTIKTAAVQQSLALLERALTPKPLKRAVGSARP